MKIVVVEKNIKEMEEKMIEIYNGIVECLLLLGEEKM